MCGAWGAHSVHSFCWLAPALIPPRYDLQACGWHHVGKAESGRHPSCVYLAPVGNLASPLASHLPSQPGMPRRRQIILLGVGMEQARARLLRLGFGDVLGRMETIHEIAARAERVARSAELIPRYRDFMNLRLDLFARDGFVRGRPLGLHPREFELIWRLAECPGEPVDKASLMAEVWRIGHDTGTNSLAVHVFRLRAKLRVAGLTAAIHTTPDGSYMLDLPDLPEQPPRPELSESFGRMALSS